MLSNCNALSQARLERATRDFKGHTQHIAMLKKDLDNVFKRIRALKLKVATQYPDSFQAIEPAAAATAGEEDDEYDIAIKERRRREAEQDGKISPINEDESLQ